VKLIQQSEQLKNETINTKQTKFLIFFSRKKIPLPPPSPLTNICRYDFSALSRARELKFGNTCDLMS
jgi:hypothetical protein